MEYPIKLYQIETMDGFEWVAEYPDVPGCVGGGATKFEAMQAAEENLNAHLDAMKELNLSIPKPSKIEFDSYSGKLSFRTSKTIHRRLAEFAEKEGVSINQALNEAVNSYLSREETISIYNRAITSVAQVFNPRYFESKTRFSIGNAFSRIGENKYGGNCYGTN